MLIIPTDIRLEESIPLVDRLRSTLTRREEIQSVSSAMALFDSGGWGRIGFTATDGQYKRMFVNVVEWDFHYTSLQNKIMPAMMVVNSKIVFSGAQDFDYAGSFGAEIIVRIAGGNLSESIRSIGKTWEDVAPELPFAYSFVDDKIATQYREEERLSAIISVGALLALFIAGLGLFGLAALSVARRTKEIIVDTHRLARDS